MEISLIADTLTTATTQGLGFANSITHRHNSIANSNLSPSAKLLQLSSSVTTVRRTLLRKKRRTRRKTYSSFESGDAGDAGEELGFFGGDGGGPIGGSWGGGRGGGGGWNFHQNWDESSWFSSFEFAYGFFYEVIYWIALSTCLHFAFEKVMRMAYREKGSMRLA